jgi:hypothetical protein
MSTLVLPNFDPDFKPVFGMLHLRPLPGAPRYDGELSRVRDAALADLHALEAGGVDGLIIENFGDVPFYAQRVPAHVVAHVTAMAAAIRAATKLPLGINVLRNDALAALGIAQAIGAEFIRVNILTGARVTDQGVVEGPACELLRLRQQLGAERIRIFADVNVKHSTPLGQRVSLEEEVRDTLGRGGADGVIVTGRGTGILTDVEDAQRASSASGDLPVLVGSGVSVDTIMDFVPHADGFVIGTAFKANGDVDEPVDIDRVSLLMRRLRG